MGGERESLFRLGLKESREGFFRRGRGRSFHVEGPKIERAQELTKGKSSVSLTLNEDSDRCCCLLARVLQLKPGSPSVG